MTTLGLFLQAIDDRGNCAKHCPEKLEKLSGAFSISLKDIEIRYFHNFLDISGDPKLCFPFSGAFSIFDDPN